MRRATTLLEVSRISFRQSAAADRGDRPFGADPAGHGEHDAVGGTRRLPGSPRRRGRGRRTMRSGWRWSRSWKIYCPMPFATAREARSRSLLPATAAWPSSRFGDHGIGISEADQAQIFERFHNLRRTSPKGGFGVGLWVTRQLVRAMEGEISVSSSPGRRLGLYR